MASTSTSPIEQDTLGAPRVSMVDATQQSNALLQLLHAQY
jgi:hypothetical protein